MRTDAVSESEITPLSDDELAVMHDNNWTYTRLEHRLLATLADKQRELAAAKAKLFSTDLAYLRALNREVEADAKIAALEAMTPPPSPVAEPLASDAPE